MSESVPLPPDERPGESGRSRVGGVRVERFEGLRAGEAIAAVRRLGLRPGPERVEGYEPDLHGFVVGQQPTEGGELAAGDEVVLFIAAPSHSRLDDDDPQPAGDEAERGCAPDAAPLPHVGEEVDVEALRVGEPAYADETVEVHELAPPADWPEDEEPFEDSEVERAPRRHEPRALGAVVRTWWRSLPGGVRWSGAGVSVCLILVAAISAGGGSTSRRSAGRVASAVRPVKVAGRTRSVGAAVESGVGRSVCGAGRCRAHARGAARLAASRAEVRVVYVGAGSVAPSAPAAAGSVERGQAAGARMGESAEEHMAREFGLP